MAWTWLIPETWDWKFGSRPRMAVVWAMTFVCIYFFMNGTDSVFLYYQFYRRAQAATTDEAGLVGAAGLAWISAATRALAPALRKGRSHRR